MRFVAAVLLAATTAAAAPPTTCTLTGDPYAEALCSYQRRNFHDAELGFRAIIDAGDPDPKTIRSIYFLARTEMKLGRFDEAATLFIRIYSLDKPFYDAWNCDYLLGECRKAQGKG